MDQTSQPEEQYLGVAIWISTHVFDFVSDWKYRVRWAIGGVHEVNWDFQRLVTDNACHSIKVYPTYIGCSFGRLLTDNIVSNVSFVFHRVGGGHLQITLKL